MEAVFKEKSYPANYPADALAVINTMSFSAGKGVKILGSMSMRSQQYAGDYDCFEEVDTNVGNPLQHLARGFQNIIKNLRSEKNVFIGDIKSGAIPKWQILKPNAGVIDNKVANYNAVECRQKIDELERDKVISGGEAKWANSLIKDSPSIEEFLEAKKELKFHIVRWSPNEVIYGSKVLRDKRRYTLEEAFSSQSMTKLDVIALIQNSRYTDFSMIYEFFSKGEPLNEFPLNVAQSLKEDIVYYKAHGNNFKVLKRELALAKLNKDSKAVAEIVPILNSDLGRLYLITSDIGTLIDLFENERKVPMKLVRFELDQMKARMGNIYNLPDFLSEEHDLIGDINAVLKMTNKAQILSRLNQIMKKMDGILNGNTKLKGGANEAERGRASKLREKYFLKTGISYDGFPERPQIYRHLSAIIHDPEENSIADGSSTLPSVSANEKQIVRNLTNFIMKEDKLIGFPLNREVGVKTPASQDNLPANQSWLGYFNTQTRAYEDEPLGVWRFFLTTGLATPSDKALGVPPIPPVGLLTMSQADKTAFVPSYYRFSQQSPNLAYVPPPPPPPPQPSFLENLGALSPLPPPSFANTLTEKALERKQAENKAEEARLLALTRELGESNAYTLLLQEQYRQPPSSGITSRDLSQRRGVIEQLQQQVGNLSMAEEDELSRARQQQEFAQSEAGRAEQARMAEQARLAEEQAQRNREEALKPRGVVSEAEKQRIAQLEEDARLSSSAEDIDMMFNRIATAFSKEALAKIPDNEPERIRSKAKILLKVIEDGRVAMKQLNQSVNFKANRAKLEAELKTFPKGLEKIKKPNATEKKQLARIAQIEDDLSFVPTDAEIERDITQNERIKKRLDEAQPKLVEIYKEYIEKPQKEAAQRSELGKLNAELMGKNIFSIDGTDSLETIVANNPQIKGEVAIDQLLPQIGVENPKITEGDTDAIASDIYDNFGRTPTTSRVLKLIAELARNINGNFETVRKELSPLQESMENGKTDPAVFQKAYKERVGGLVKGISTKIFYFFYSNPFNIVAYRHAMDEEEPPETQRMIEAQLYSFIDGRTRPEGDIESMSPREAVIDKEVRSNLMAIVRDEMNLANRLVSFTNLIRDKNLIEMSRISYGVNKLLKNGLRFSIRANRNLKAEMDYFKNILNNTGDLDEEMFAEADKKSVKEFLAESRDIMRGLTPRERDMIYLSCALKLNTKPSEIMSLEFPSEVWQGDVGEAFSDAPAKSTGSGRRRKLKGGNEGEKKALLMKLTDRLHKLLRVAPTKKSYMEIDSLITNIKNEIEDFLRKPYSETNKNSLRHYLHHTLLRLIERIKDVDYGGGRSRRRRKE